MTQEEAKYSSDVSALLAEKSCAKHVCYFNELVSSTIELYTTRLRRRPRPVWLVWPFDVMSCRDCNCQMVEVCQLDAYKCQCGKTKARSSRWFGGPRHGMCPACGAVRVKRHAVRGDTF